MDIKNVEGHNPIHIAKMKSYVNTLGELSNECLYKKYFALTGANEINKGKCRLLSTGLSIILIGFIEYPLMYPFIDIFWVLISYTVFFAF